MKTYTSLFFVALLAITFAACSSDSKNNSEEEEFQITSISPEIVLRGGEVNIKGIGFGTIIDSVSVKFGTLSGEVLDLVDTLIVAQVPSTISLGNVDVYVTINSLEKMTMVVVSDELVGTWVSEGTGQVAPGLASTLKTKRITATFNENQTYTVVSVDSSDAAVTFTGTWEGGNQANGSIRTIVLNQSTPAALVSSGIFQVEGNNLTYEVIQTTPAIDGFAAATVTGGFGSTSYLTFPLGQTWIQRYVRSSN